MRLGNWNSAELLLYSVNFQKIYNLQQQNKWDTILHEIKTISMKLQETGAEGLFICSNTLHKIASELQTHIKIPIIDVRIATAEEIVRKSKKNALLLGTKFTMGGTFYQEIMERYHINPITPHSESQEIINNIIYKELSNGIINIESKKYLLTLIEKIRIETQIDSIILGCTELPILIKNNDIDIPLFDTMEIHIKKAVDFILGEK